MKHLTLLLALSIGVAVSAQSVKNLTPAAKPEDVGFSPERLGRIDNMIAEHVKNKTLPGAVVYIVRNGKVAYHKAYGTSNMATNAPLKKDDIFRIASQSKAVTSLAVMMLFEEGKFLLDDPLSWYIPEFKNPAVVKSFNEKDSSYTTEPAKREITIRHLLTHT
jgi:CubicO group peptidase (beta-lactamase class C family)